MSDNNIEIQELDNGEYRVRDCDGNWFPCKTKSKADEMKRHFETQKQQKQQRESLLNTMLKKMIIKNKEQKSIQNSPQDSTPNP